MIKLIVKIFLIILAALFQVVLMPLLSIKGIWPNLILVGLVVLTLLDFRNDGLLVAGLGGIFLDFVGPFFFGFYTFIFIGLWFLIIILSKRFFSEVNLLIIIFMTFFSSSLLGILSCFALGRLPDWLVLIEGGYGAFLSLFFFLILMSANKSGPIVKLGKI
ncbi:hypothetical protein A2V71_02315 [Candidatus Berkelbacteria bacterium RBG_13_40_8]|uniref:Rod shape-determining protein MreD n=1 Tax=Candidatus Berkelbacteria bacterium RBG_13_40_8 TaxID=1797467 RepID=A0A1F5DLL6_9BACT|nr:MAG: hypothetical protein A2V71_02315 [Candidatus Berkelbacteria bacterium RBG_13_40_8]